MVDRVIKVEPLDLNQLLAKSSRRGRKRKTSEEKRSAETEVEGESDDYRRKRLRNNIAVRKSRERAKVRHEDTQQKLLELATDNLNQKKLITTIKTDYDGLETRLTTVQGRLEDILKLNVRLRQFIFNLPPEFQPKFSF